MIVIDVKSRSPIYEQIITRVEDMAVRGALRPGDPIPSVRQLALSLSLNPNTIQRAYTELERRGVILTLPGRGSFLSENVEFLKAERKSKLEDSLVSLARQAVFLLFSRDDFLSLCKTCYDKCCSEKPEKAEGGQIP